MRPLKFNRFLNPMGGGGGGVILSVTDKVQAKMNILLEKSFFLGGGWAFSTYSLTIDSILFNLVVYLEHFVLEGGRFHESQPGFRYCESFFYLVEPGP